MGLHVTPELIDPPARYGSAHGRFQPFHRGHLAYVLAAKANCEFLWIGITKYDVTPAAMNPLGTHREQPANNPLTYFERVEMIALALEEERISRSAFSFIPFPIETPTSLPAFLPTTIPCFTTICEEWNRRKIDVLRDAGYEVRVLWEREKEISGALIREAMIRGDESWRDLVPPAVARSLDRLDIAARLRKLHHHAGA
jgi:nicotinamide-nucleotide adenylyltransferase